MFVLGYMNAVGFHQDQVHITDVTPCSKTEHSFPGATQSLSGFPFTKGCSCRATSLPSGKRCSIAQSSPTGERSLEWQVVIDVQVFACYDKKKPSFCLLASPYCVEVGPSHKIQDGRNTNGL